MAKLFASSKKRQPALSRLPLSLYLFAYISLKILTRALKRQYNDFNLYVLVSCHVFARAVKRALNDHALRLLVARQVTVFRLSRAFKPRQLASAVVVLAGLAGTVYFGMQLVNAKTPPAPVEFSVPVPPETNTSKSPKGLEPSKPTGIKIDTISLNADIVELGKQADGSMETPGLYSGDTGWYKHGPTPGETGPAIITGHVDNLDGPSVFWRLGELKPGDEVEVRRQDGRTVEFKVDSIQQFAKDEFPTKKVYGNIDHPGLRLITCGGSFDYSTGDYTGNTVVFASVGQ